MKYFYFIFKFVNQNFIDHLLGKSLSIFSYKFNDKIYIGKIYFLIYQFYKVFNFY